MLVLPALPHFFYLVGISLKDVVYIFLDLFVINIDVFCVLRNDQVSLLLLEILDLLVHGVIVLYDVYLRFNDAFL